jgi:hypothetical protein
MPLWPASAAVAWIENVERVEVIMAREAGRTSARSGRNLAVRKPAVRAA